MTDEKLTASHTRSFLSLTHPNTHNIGYHMARGYGTGGWVVSFIHSLSQKFIEIRRKSLHLSRKLTFFLFQLN